MLVAGIGTPAKSRPRYHVHRQHMIKLPFYFNIAGRGVFVRYAVRLQEADETMRYITGQSIASLDTRGWLPTTVRQANLDEPLAGE